MNKVLDNYLCEAYPRIFIERVKSTQDSCMGRGFECGNGWFPVLNSVCHQIQEHIDWHNKFCKLEKGKIPQFEAKQVKEKFGSLRIYFRGGDDYCCGVIATTEALSRQFCELCGKGGQLYVGRTEGWITTLCEDCSKKLKRKIKPNKEIRNLLTKAIKEDQKHYA